MLISIKQRISSIFIDFGIFILLGIPFAILSIVYQFFANGFYIPFILFTAWISLFLCKDLYAQGQSKGKAICNLRIVESSDNAASPFKLILRNLFMIIWPIELFMILINPESRLADIIFGTKVIYCENKSATVKPSVFFKYYVVTFLLCAALISTILFLIQSCNNNTIKILKLLYS